MYLHLGQDYVIRTQDVVGIFDLETTTVSQRGQEFLNRTQKEGAVVTLSDELPKSYVLTTGQWADTVYLSGLSPAALERRMHHLTAEESLIESI